MYRLYTSNTHNFDLPHLYVFDHHGILIWGWGGANMAEDCSLNKQISYIGEHRPTPFDSSDPLPYHPSKLASQDFCPLNSTDASCLSSVLRLQVFEPQPPCFPIPL